MNHQSTYPPLSWLCTENIVKIIFDEFFLQQCHEYKDSLMANQHALTSKFDGVYIESCDKYS